MKNGDVLDVLSKIRKETERFPPGEELIRAEAYYAWQRRGKGAGRDLEDWFNAREELVIGREFLRLENAIYAAKEKRDYESQLALSVVNNVAILLDMRPCDIRGDTSLQEMDFRKLQLIVAAVGQEIGYIFSQRYYDVSNVAQLFGRMWVYEYRHFRGVE